MDELAELRPFGEWRRRALAQIGEDQADRFSCRIRRHPNSAAERLRLGWLLGALTGRVEGPAVISARDLLASHGAGRELRPAVRAPVHRDVGLPALAAIEREPLAHDLDGDGLSLREGTRQVDRLPEAPEIAPADRPRAGVDEIAFLRACRLGAHAGPASRSSIAAGIPIATLAFSP